MTTTFAQEARRNGIVGAVRSAPTDVVLEWVAVNPEMASAWLKTRAPNRQVTTPRVEQYARDITNGRWWRNGETIKFNEQGQLIDGQHRLEAIVLAGIPVALAVARNVPSAAMPTIDTGRARSFNDVLRIRDVVNAKAFAAAAVWVYRHEHGLMQNNVPISHAELEDVVMRHPELHQSVQRIVGGPRIVPPAAMAFVHYMASRTSPSKADAFAHGVLYGTALDGSGLSAGNPAFRLRERFIAQRGSRSKFTRVESMALTIRAWSLFRADRLVRFLRWRAKGPAAEVFPEFGE